MIVSAIGIYFFKDLVAAVVASTIISLVAAVYFLILQAPDVAITEAAIDGGLTAAIFMIAIRQTKREEEEDE
jgi:uncharacterized MnhB-related membrane protein